MDNNIPSEYKPLGAWAYVGYNILFAIPLVGFILLIVFAFSNSNLNRRNYARSYFCTWLLAIILIALVYVILIASGTSIDALNNAAQS